MKNTKAAKLIIFAIVSIDLLGFAIVLPLLPRYGEFYNASPIALGLLMACFSIMQFMFAPLWGRISDRIGRRPILLLGLAGSTFFYGVFGWISTLSPNEPVLGQLPLTWLFLSRIGAGIAGATIPTAQAFISDVTTKAQRGQGMALIGAAFGVGFTFGPIIGAGFVSTDPAANPSEWPGYVASMISGLALITAIFKLPESLNPESRPAAAHWLSVRDLNAAVKQPSILLLLTTIFVATFAFAQFETTLPYMTKLIGLSDRHNFYLFAYIGLLLTLFQGGLVRRMIPKLGEYKTGIYGAICLAVGLVLVGLVAPRGSFSLLMIVLPVSVLGFAGITPALQAMLSLGAKDTEQGEILGLGQSMSALARICGPIVGYGLLHLELTLWPYWAGAALMIVVAFMIGRLKSSELVSDSKEDSEPEVQPEPVLASDADAV
ncbi:MAG: MFS transporter [Rubinisphaera brasiliensis]|uniref:MFS transporter n=1 Tax=Rubinisphaera brasiliensis TaxID=119 RepID=UPI00391AEBEB